MSLSALDGIYCGPPPAATNWLAHWNFDVWLLAALLALVLLARRQRSGLAAVAVLVLAFVSPLCAASSALFSARVVHHVLLIAVAAPLLARCLPGQPRGAAAVALALATVVLWLWHLPVAYDWALSNKAAYWLMQLSLLSTALWFWQHVFAAQRSPVQALTLITAGFAQMGLLGALLTFAPQPLYAAHALAPYGWGLTPLLDQQLAGILMWVPAGLPYALIAGGVGRRGWVGLRNHG